MECPGKDMTSVSRSFLLPPLLRTAAANGFILWTVVSVSYAIPCILKMKYLVKVKRDKKKMMRDEESRSIYATATLEKELKNHLSCITALLANVLVIRKRSPLFFSGECSEGNTANQNGYNEAAINHFYYSHVRVIFLKYLLYRYHVIRVGLNKDQSCVTGHQFMKHCKKERESISSDIEYDALISTRVVNKGDSLVCQILDCLQLSAEWLDGVSSTAPCKLQRGTTLDNSVHAANSASFFALSVWRMHNIITSLCSPHESKGSSECSSDIHGNQSWSGFLGRDLFASKVDDSKNTLDKRIKSLSSKVKEFPFEIHDNVSPSLDIVFRACGAVLHYVDIRWLLLWMGSTVLGIAWTRWCATHRNSTLSTGLSDVVLSSDVELLEWCARAIVDGLEASLITKKSDTCQRSPIAPIVLKTLRSICGVWFSYAIYNALDEILTEVSFCIQELISQQIVDEMEINLFLEAAAMDTVDIIDDPMCLHINKACSAISATHAFFFNFECGLRRRLNLIASLLVVLKAPLVGLTILGTVLASGLLMGIVDRNVTWSLGILRAEHEYNQEVSLRSDNVYDGIIDYTYSSIYHREERSQLQKVDAFDNDKPPSNRYISATRLAFMPGWMKEYVMCPNGFLFCTDSDEIASGTSRNDSQYVSPPSYLMEMVDRWMCSSGSQPVNKINKCSSNSAIENCELCISLHPPIKHNSDITSTTQTTEIKKHHSVEKNKALTLVDSAKALHECVAAYTVSHTMSLPESPESNSKDFDSNSLLDVDEEIFLPQITNTLPCERTMELLESVGAAQEYVRLTAEVHAAVLLSEAHWSWSALFALFFERVFNKASDSVSMLVRCIAKGAVIYGLASPHYSLLGMVMSMIYSNPTPVVVNEINGVQGKPVNISPIDDRSSYVDKAALDCVSAVYSLLPVEFQLGCSFSRERHLLFKWLMSNGEARPDSTEGRGPLWPQYATVNNNRRSIDHLDATYVEDKLDILIGTAVEGVVKQDKKDPELVADCLPGDDTEGSHIDIASEYFPKQGSREPLSFNIYKDINCEHNTRIDQNGPEEGLFIHRDDSCDDEDEYYNFFNVELEQPSPWDCLAELYVNNHGKAGEPNSWKRSGKGNTCVDTWSSMTSYSTVRGKSGYDTSSVAVNGGSLSAEQMYEQVVNFTTLSIEFRNVWFAYGSEVNSNGERNADDDTKWVLRDVSFVVEPGSFVGLVGGSGCGKSTLISLILMMYAPTKGRVLLNGLDTSRCINSDDFTYHPANNNNIGAVRALRRRIAYVGSDCPLFPSMTVEGNISIGDPAGLLGNIPSDLKTSMIHKALEKASAKEFVLKKPSGLMTLCQRNTGKTPLYSGGRAAVSGRANGTVPVEYSLFAADGEAPFSGGEEQRLCLARAFSKCPNRTLLYLFDEATSALDVETEKSVQVNLLKSIDRHDGSSNCGNSTNNESSGELVVNKTTCLVAAHRLSTLKCADMIIVLGPDGHIAQKGSWETLLNEEGGQFLDFVRAQNV